MSSQPKTVLITGCSDGGIGSAMALEFQRRGMHVFATARNLKKMTHLAQVDRISLLQLDVTSTASIHAAVAEVSKQTGGSLDFLVNNAGRQYTYPMIEADLDVARDMFELNVFSVIAVCQAFMPLIAASQGTIVNVSSMVAHVHTPFMGFYCGSKAAMEMATESMRLELAPLNIRVVTLIPGAVTSHIMSNGPVPELPDTSPFKPAEKEMVALATGQDGRPRMATDVFARKAVGDILGGVPRKIWRGQMASTMYWLTILLPLALLVRPYTGLVQDMDIWLTTCRIK